MQLLFYPNLKSLHIGMSLGGHMPLTFRTPPVSPPKPSYLTGMRRVCSLKFRPHLMNSPDSGLAVQLLGSSGPSGASDVSFLPQSMIYNWSCGHFSKPLLTAMDDSEDIIGRREEMEKVVLNDIGKCQRTSVTNCIIKLPAGILSLRLAPRLLCCNIFHLLSLLQMKMKGLGYGIMWKRLC